jgi:hypothetical protein
MQNYWLIGLFMGALLLGFLGAMLVGLFVARATVAALRFNAKEARRDRDDVQRELDAVRLVLGSSIDYGFRTEQIAQIVAHSAPFCSELADLLGVYGLEPAKIVASRPPLTLALERIEQRNWIAFEKLRPRLGRPRDTCKAPKLNSHDGVSDSVRPASPESSESGRPPSTGGKAD